MTNPLFDAVLKEADPMYDAAVITEDGTEYWHNENSNFANNGHSVTKFFISSAVGILVSDGKISLSDKVTDFFICYLTIYRPIVYVNIEEVHIYRDLYALAFDIFVFIYCLDDDDLSICNRSHLIVVTDSSSIRYSEEKAYESHEEHRNNAERI